MRVYIKVEDAKTRGAMRAARRETNRGVKEGLRRGVERHGLPAARRLAPGRRIPRALRAGATSRTAFLELVKKLAPHGPLLNYGGVRRDVIRAKPGSALMTPRGPRAAVLRPRRYRAQRFLERAVAQTRDDVVREAQEVIAETFDRAGLEVD